MNAAAALPRPAFHPWPYALIAFFTVLITVIASFVIWSLRQDMELVGADYYDQEMRFQQRIDSIRRAQVFGGQITIVHEAGRITVTLPTAHAAKHPAGILRLYRPSDAKLDREMKLAVDATGTQQLAVPGLRSGLWKARVSWTVGAEEFFRDETLIIP